MFSRVPLLLLCMGISLPVGAQQATPATTYGAGQALSDVKYEFGGLFLGITALGVDSWNWGSADFHFNSEGWFGMDAGSAGVDKFGHAYSAYAMSEFLSRRLQAHADSPSAAALSAGLMSWGLMFYVEVFDGISAEHGFSYEDLLMNTGGIALSYLRSTIPALRDKLDIRIQYWPSEHVGGFHPVTDYNGQKYLAALKLSGFDRLRDTPWRYLELHAGYYSRGFVKAGQFSDEERRASAYVGISVNFTELLVKPFQQRLPRTARYAAIGLEYVQPPFTSVEVAGWERRRPPRPVE